MPLACGTQNYGMNPQDPTAMICVGSDRKKVWGFMLSQGKPEANLQLIEINKTGI